MITQFAEEKDATTAQVALARLLAKKAWIVPIPGRTKVSRLEENLGGAAIELSAEDVRALEEVSSGVKVEGGRYRATRICRGRWSGNCLRERYQTLQSERVACLIMGSFYAPLNGMNHTLWGTGFSSAKCHRRDADFRF